MSKMTEEEFRGTMQGKIDAALVAIGSIAGSLSRAVGGQAYADQVADSLETSAESVDPHIAQLSNAPDFDKIVREMTATREATKQALKTIADIVRNLGEVTLTTHVPD